LTTIPGVRSASLSTYPPISNDDGSWTQSIGVDGAPLAARPGTSTVYFNAVSPAFFRTVGIPLVQGRDFTASDTTSSQRVVVINETLARRYFPGQDAVGRLITIGRSENRRDMTVIAVVKDAKYQRLQEEPRSIAYLPRLQHPGGNLFAEIRTSAPSAVAGEIRRHLRQMDEVVPLRIEAVADRIRDSLVTERVLAILGGALAAAAVVLACASLYGLLAYGVARRAREIGIRIALGASRHRVLRVVMSDTLTLVTLGVISGLLASLWLGRFAESFLFGVTARDPLSLSAAAGVMLAVGGLAGYLPARRAARLDPLTTLRAE
jgi:predicted permease